MDRSDMDRPLRGRGELNQAPGCRWWLFVFAAFGSFGMLFGAAVHSASPAAAERPRWLYLESTRETCVVCVGSPPSWANQSCGMVSVVGEGSVSSEVGECDSMESPVMGL